jgi:hypothetical protein
MRYRHADPNLGRAGKTLALEALEDRTCPSSVVLSGHTLSVTGTSGSDVITVRDGGHGNVNVSVRDSAGHVVSRSVTGVNSIQINALGGNDKLDYALTSTLTGSETISVNLGSGNNTALMNFSPGVSAPSLKVNVVGGANDDTLQATFGAITNTNVNFQSNLGNGNDHVFANFNGALNGVAHVLFHAACGTGYDGVAVSVKANIAASAFLDVEALGGAHMDTMHLDYQGILKGTLLLHEQGGPQYSWLESSVTLNAGSTGSLTDRVIGGTGGGDLLTLKVHDLSHHLRSINALADGGGGGGDQAIVTPGVRVVRASVT